jgi:hypothetical protein
MYLQFSIYLDLFDEKGLDILKTANTSDFSDHDMDEEKEFVDEGEYMDEIETMEGGEFAEEEMVHEEFGGTETQNFGQKSFNEEDSDDSLSEMDPIALQQQMSMNLSGKIDGQKVRYTCTQCPYRCNALRSFKCHSSSANSPPSIVSISSIYSPSSMNSFSSSIS